MTDPFPGDPVVQGQWRNIKGNLIWLGGDFILEWYPDSGLYRLWPYDSTATGTDYLLPDVPWLEGTWPTIRSPHKLVYLGGDRVLDWEPGTGGVPYRIWHHDRWVRGDPFPGDPVVEGQWDATKLRHPALIYLGRDRVLNYNGGGGGYSIFRYDRTVTGKGDPFVGPIVEGRLQPVRCDGADVPLTEDGRVLMPLDGDRVLEIFPSVVQPGDQYRLWRYDRDVTSGDPLPGPAIAEGVLTPMMYFAQYGYIGQNLVLQTDPPNSRSSIRYRVWRYARDTLLAPGRSESWQIEVGADDSVWAVDDSHRLWRWDGAKWVQPTSYARAVQVTVGDCDHIWHLNSIGEIWHWLGEYWQQDPQVAALSIAAAADFTVWAIGSRGQILRRVGTVGATWEEPTPYASGVQIAVGSKDVVWHRNSANQMWAWNGSGWNQLPDQALDISVAADGTACRVGLDNRLYRWTGGQWLEMPTDGRVAQVSVGGANNIWYVSLDNQIFSWSGTEFGLKMTLPV